MTSKKIRCSGVDRARILHAAALFFILDSAGCTKSCDRRILQERGAGPAVSRHTVSGSAQSRQLGPGAIFDKRESRWVGDGAGQPAMEHRH